MDYVETDGEEYDTFSSDLEINGLRFVLTCYACPEQYDVYDGDKQVGYVRLRGGHLRAEYPDVCGKPVYSSEIGDDAWAGMFTNNSERKFHLEKIANELINAKREAEVQG